MLKTPGQKIRIDCGAKKLPFRYSAILRSGDSFSRVAIKISRNLMHVATKAARERMATAKEKSKVFAGKAITQSFRVDG